jgi:hypothetical protein
VARSVADAKALSSGAAKALKLFEDGCVRYHDEFVRKFRENKKAYDGILEIASDAAQWTSKQHPPFIKHIVETTLAGLVDTRLRYRVRPMPRLYEPGEAELVRAAAKAHEALHAVQLKQDHFNEKLRPFALQDLIAGLTAAKTGWSDGRTTRRCLKVVPHPAAMEMGTFLPMLVEGEEESNDSGPTTEVVNIEDFFWHEAAVELQRCPVLAHRVYMHFSELKEAEKRGQFKNVDALRDGDRGGATETRDSDGSNRAKDMVEVLEIWWRDDEGIQTVTLGNRNVELKAPQKNPFWHGEYPFVVCSTRPDLFRIPGTSMVDLIRHLQLAHWDLENQTRDNVRLINNAIMWFRSDVDDPDSFEFEPGARWLVEDPAQVQMWSPDPIAANIALPHLSRLEQQMQNLAGGHPFTSTSEARNTGADTATEAALVTNLAQRATIAMKEQLNYAYERIGQQRTQLNQQFIRTPVVAEQIGLDSESEFLTILPQILQPPVRFDIGPMNESLMMSERKAQTNAWYQMFLQALPVHAALSQVNAASPLNADEAFKEWLLANDIPDPERFFSKKPPPPMQPPGSPPGAPAEAAGPGGVTAPQATDPVSSPSSDMTINPAAAMQQTMAKVGGLQGG